MTNPEVIDSTQGSEIETNDPELFGYFFPASFAECDEPSKLVYFRQSQIYIKGGTLDGFTFEGSNDLTSESKISLF